MTTTANKTISSDIRTKAARKAKITGENTVVYEAVIGKENRELLATATQWENAPETTRANFLAVVDENGNYVD